MPANVENSAVAAELENVSFQSNPKGQCQRMFKLPYNCAHITGQQGNAQNPSNQVSAVSEPRNCRYTNGVQKKQRNQRSNCQHSLDPGKQKGEKMEAMTNFIFLGSKIMALNLQASQPSFQSRTGMCTSHGMVAGPAFTPGLAHSRTTSDSPFL